MRKCLAIFLLFVLACPYWGSQVFLLHKKVAIRELVKERILLGVGENEMVRLSFTISDTKKLLRWEHSREFEYRGEMYDVVKSQQKGDSIVYWCIWDKAETQINRQLNQLVAAAAAADPQHKSCLDNMLSFLKLLFFQAQKEKETIVASLAMPSMFFILEKGSLPVAPPVPPPET